MIEKITVSAIARVQFSSPPHLIAGAQTAREAAQSATATISDLEDR
ncbi:hypothetical protein EP7_000338 [Isosphaeraceae bacterium EP7]